jgi:Ca2+-binding EF-hand superfamily protein
MLTKITDGQLTEMQLSQTVDKTMNDLDSDGDGKLDFNDFKKVFSS